MKLKFWGICIIIFALIGSLVSCGYKREFNDVHKHEFNDWTQIKEATCTADNVEERICSCGEKEFRSTVNATGHIWKNGICEYCSMNCINEIGKIIMNDPDQITDSNTYIKSFLATDLCPDEIDESIIHSVGLGVGYSSNSNTLVFQVSHSSGYQITQNIIIYGSVTKYYDYQFEYDNRNYGGAFDRLIGNFDAQNLKKSSSFSYSKVESTNTAALKYYIESHQEYACRYTQYLMPMLNGLCQKYNLPFTASELGFDGY